MAFFSGLSSSIGKKLLLYGLRHIDILDKDPADFVSVDVGKRTTLEVRDVGLHIRYIRRSVRLLKWQMMRDAIAAGGRAVASFGQGPLSPAAAPAKDDALSNR
jgi:hypothetical protein